MTAYAIILWPLLTMYVKRLHDLGFSGWWLLGSFAAAAILDGIVPKGYLGVALMLIIGFVPGRRGDNRFGPDPIASP